MKLLNSGCPPRGVDVNSGWNWQPTNQGWSGSSISSQSDSAFVRAATFSPTASSLRQVVVVDLVAVAVPLVDDVALVDPMHQRARNHVRRLRAETHRAAEVRLLVAPLDLPVGVLPFGDERDHRMRRVGVELRAVRALEPGLVPRELDDRELHAQADAEVRQALLARVLDRPDLALDAALAEAARHQDRVDALQRADALALDRLGVDVADLRPCSACGCRRGSAPR